jgi:hypothetical protein
VGSILAPLILLWAVGVERDRCGGQLTPSFVFLGAHDSFQSSRVRVSSGAAVVSRVAPFTRSEGPWRRPQWACQRARTAYTCRSFCNLTVYRPKNGPIHQSEVTIFRADFRGRRRASVRPNLFKLFPGHLRATYETKLLKGQSHRLTASSFNRALETRLKLHSHGDTMSHFFISPKTVR